MAWVLFFDGDCGFCNNSVKWVHRLDKQGRIDFAPLQGELSKKLGYEKYAKGSGGTMVLRNEADQRVFLHGDAVVQLGKILGGVWKLMASCFALLPRNIRDGLYGLIANNRAHLPVFMYSCQLPDKALEVKIRE